MFPTAVSHWPTFALAALNTLSTPARKSSKAFAADFSLGPTPGTQPNAMAAPWTMTPTADRNVSAIVFITVSHSFAYPSAAPAVAANTEVTMSRNVWDDRSEEHTSELQSR